MTDKLRAVVVVFAIVVGGSGCSFAFVSGPPANHAQLPYFDCSTSRVAPALDTVLTVIQAIRIAYDLSLTQAEYDAKDLPIARNADIAIGVGLGVLGAAGMWYGFSKTAECRAAKEQMMMRSVNPAMPPPMMPPPSGQLPPPAPMPPAPLPPAQ
jgi:hypothetical protein